MPLAGSVGAIAAGQRAAHRRHGNLSSRSSFNQKSSSFNQKSSLAKANGPCTWETSSVDSKSSILSKLKQQMLEKGDFLKKKQQAFAEAVQKGLKITSGSSSNQLHQDAEDQKCKSHAGPLPPKQQAQEQPQQQVQESPETSRTVWLDTLENMGFERTHVKDAIASLGGRARTIDDVVERLLAKAAAREQPESRTSSRASSSRAFQVSLKRGPHQKLGIQVDMGGRHCVVETVEADGSVAQWNAAHSPLQVKCGDCIVEVNGITGSPQDLVKAMLASDTLTMSVESHTADNTSPSAAAVPEPSFSKSTAASSANAEVAEEGLRSIASGSADSHEHVSGFAEVADDSSAVAEASETAASYLTDMPAPFNNPQEAMEDETHEADELEQVAEAEPTEQREAEVDSGLVTPTAGATFEIVDLAEEVSVPELASKVVEAAFVNASQKLLAKYGPQYAKAKGGEDFSPRSPVRGGA